MAASLTHHSGRREGNSFLDPQFQNESLNTYEQGTYAVDNVLLLYIKKHGKNFVSATWNDFNL